MANIKPIHDQQKSAEIFKSLGGKIRLYIVHSLFKKEKCVSELVEQLGYSQSHISHHLKTLKNSGIIQSQRIGHKIFYRISSNIVKNISKMRGKALDLGCCEIRFKEHSFNKK